MQKRPIAWPIWSRLAAGQGRRALPRACRAERRPPRLQRGKLVPYAQLGNHFYLAIDAGPIHDDDGKLIAVVERCAT